MRLEANVSVRPQGQTGLPNYKVELKNINSFRFLEKAIAYELERQACELNEGRTPIQETRGWNETKGETFSQRTKEEAEDYRYFPDPDLPPMRFTEEEVNQIAAELPELPAELKTRWTKEYGIDSKYADLLAEEKEMADWAEQIFQEAKKQNLEPSKVANAIVNKKVSAQVGDDAQKVISAFSQLQQTDSVDEAELAKVIAEVLAENPKTVDEYKSGKTQVFGFFMGQTQRKLGKKVDSQVMTTALQKALSQTAGSKK